MLGDRYLHQCRQAVPVQCQLEIGNPTEQAGTRRGAHCYQVYVGIKRRSHERQQTLWLRVVWP
jgi:hypothetical protein